VITPWLDIARAELGVHETGATPRILEFLGSTSLPKRLKDTDQTAWCGAFVNWCLLGCGYQVAEHPARAASWRKYGRPTLKLYSGCVVVVTRGRGRHHVAFCDVVTPDGGALLLGGNQRNSVCVRHYPAERIVATRWPVPWVVS
jgi:flagellar protein FlgJ